MAKYPDMRTNTFTPTMHNCLNNILPKVLNEAYSISSPITDPNKKIIGVDKHDKNHKMILSNSMFDLRVFIN